MAVGTLYAISGHPCTHKILIAAQYSGAHVKLADFVFGETNKTEEFLKKFPLGKVPAFVTSNGKCLVESNAIAYFVANDQLRGGKDPVNQAEIIQWFDFADGVITPIASKLVFPLLGIMPFKKQTADAAKQELKSALSFLNDYLLSRTYLVGERITLADIVLACTFLQLYSHVLDKNFRKPFQNVNRWFTTIVNQTQAKAVLGDFELCEEATEFDSKKFAEFQGVTTAPKEKKDKKQAKKEVPKKEEEPANDDLDPTELALAAEPKPKDPFTLLPAGTFKMDDWKRFYSNEDESKVVGYFWEKFDKENYSIWFSEYKYNNELTQVFMSCNLISGMFQRLDKMRSQTFASVCLFGENNNSSISGIWIWRGQDLAFELSPDWKVDYDVYEWTKLDPNDPKTKQLVEQYFLWVGSDKQGRPFKEGKIFK